jgi:transposase
MSPTSPRNVAASTGPTPNSWTRLVLDRATGLAPCLDLSDALLQLAHVGHGLGGQLPAGDRQLAGGRDRGQQRGGALGGQVAAGAAGDQVHQQPVQPVDGLGARGDQVLAVLGQQVQDRRLVCTCGRLRQRADGDPETAATVASLRALARRIQLLDAEIADHTRAITALVLAWHPELLTPTGVGPIVAAVVLCAWSHPGRCPSEAAFAMLGGAAPIPASSGQTVSGQTVRVRLNCSGDRQLNQALHVVVLTRLRYDPATRAYAQRRRAEGKTNREIRRCLVRYIACQL